LSVVFWAVLAVLAVAVPQPASAQAIVGAYTYYYPSWGGWYGWGYYPLGFVRQAGLKFDLGRLPKAEKEIVRLGIVHIDEYPFGEVGRYDGRLNSMLRLDPGAYEVSIVLPDGRQWGGRYLVRFGEATPVYPPRLANFFPAEAPQNSGGGTPTAPTAPAAPTAAQQPAPAKPVPASQPQPAPQTPSARGSGAVISGAR
jgi:hypothetical protein